MIHEFSAGLCVHCGLPPRYAPPGEICQVNKYAEPAKRALAAIGLEYVGFEPRGMYATYQSPLSVGFCERMFWPQIEAILDLMVKAKAKCVCEMVKEFSGPMVEDAV